MAHAKDVVPTEGLGQPDVPECPRCGTSFRRALVRVEAEGRLLGYFPADVCERGHDFLTDESGQSVEALAKARGLFRTGVP